MGLSLPHDATSTLYIEGLPADASEREVAHIFRRYDGHGFQSVRMRAIESSKSPGTNLFLCFAEFDNPHQATVALCKPPPSLGRSSPFTRLSPPCGSMRIRAHPSSCCCACLLFLADGLQGYRVDPKTDLNTSMRISFAKAKGTRGPPPQRAPPPPRFDDSYSRDPHNLPREPREPPSREEHRERDQRDQRDQRNDRDRYDDRYEDEGRGGYDDDRRGYDNDRGRGGYRRADAREHHDAYREDYEDSELGDDVFQRADQVSMHGVTDT